MDDSPAVVIPTPAIALDLFEKIVVGGGPLCRPHRYSPARLAKGLWPRVRRTTHDLVARWA
jgi:hypothetical protein